MARFFAFQRSVKIVNAKLTLIFWLLWALFLGGGLVNFILSRKHHIKEDISNRIVTETRIESPGFALLRERVADAMNTSDFCTAPRKYDYCWDSSCERTYENYTCRPMCHENQNDPKCVSPHEVGNDYISGTIELFTSIQDMVTNSPTSSSHGLQSDNYWVMSVDHLGIGFTYSYEMTKYDPFTTAASSLFGSEFAKQTFIRSSSPHYASDTLVTVILDVEGQLWKTVLPSESIRITVKELLQLMGNENLLDEPNVYGVPNQLPTSGASQGKPPPRLTGAWIDLELGCYTGRNPNLLDVDLGELAAAELCTIRPRRIPIGWVSERHRHDRFGNGTLLHRRYSGLKVTITPSGEIEYLDFNYMFLNLVALMVILSYPAEIVSFIAQTCFGHLSTIYKKVLVDEFDIMTQVAGAAAKLSAGTLAFESLTNMKPSQTMTSRTLQNPLRTLLCDHPDLQDDEVDAMARFCVFEMSSLQTKARPPSRSQRLMHQMGLDTMASEIREMRSSGSQHRSHGINVDKFSAAYCMDNVMDLRDLAKLFDKDRKVSFLERFFTPSLLWKSVHRARAIFDDEPADTGGTSRTSPTQVEWQEDECPEAAQLLNQVRAEFAERLAKSEREMKTWMNVISGAVSAIETNMRELERGSGQLGQKSDTAGSAHEAVSERDSPVAETLCSGLPDFGALGELQEQMAMLEKRLEVMAIDVASLKSTQVSVENPAPSVAGKAAVPEDVIEHSLGTRSIGTRSLGTRVTALEGSLAAVNVDVWKLSAARTPGRDDVGEHARRSVGAPWYSAAST